MPKNLTYFNDLPKEDSTSIGIVGRTAREMWGGGGFILDAFNRLPVDVAVHAGAMARVCGSRGRIVLCLYREPPTWQGLAVISRSSASLPGVGSDSRVSFSMLDMAVYLY